MAELNEDISAEAAIRRARVAAEQKLCARLLDTFGEKLHDAAAAGDDRALRRAAEALRALLRARPRLAELLELQAGP